MNTISTNIIQQQNIQFNKQKEKTDVVELTKVEIIASKDLTPEQKMEKLGIKKMSVEEMATGIADQLLDI